MGKKLQTCRLPNYNLVSCLYPFNLAKFRAKPVHRRVTLSSTRYFWVFPNSTEYITFTTLFLSKYDEYQDIKIWLEGAVFFFPVTFFGLPVTLFEKVPVILKKCPWQKTPNFARENWLVARDKKAKKMPVKNEKWPWQFLQICKSARDNFWFFPVKKQKVPVTNQLFFLRNFKSPVKVTGFFSGKSSLVIHSFETRKFCFFAEQKEEKEKFFFVYHYFHHSSWEFLKII